MAAHNDSLSQEEISFKTDVYYRMGFISYHQREIRIGFISQSIIPKVIPGDQLVDFRDVEKYFIESKLSKTYLDKIQTIADKAFKKRILITSKFQSNYDENNTFEYEYLNYVLESLRYQDETSFKTECFIRMGALSQDRTVIHRNLFSKVSNVTSNNSYIKFYFVDVHSYFPIVSQEQLDKLFAVLDMAYEKEIYPEIWDAEKWNNDWWKYLDFIFETLNAEPENPKFKIYHDLGVVRNNGDRYSIILGNPVAGMKKLKSVSEIKKLIITQSPKYMSEEIFYIAKRILAGDKILHSVESYIETNRWSEFLSDVMTSLTGVKTLEKAKLNAYIQLGIVSKINFGKMEKNRHGCGYSVRFEYQGRVKSILRRYPDALSKKEQRRKIHQGIIDFLEQREQVNTPSVTKLINLILTRVVTNVKIVHGDFGEKIIGFNFSVRDSDILRYYNYNGKMNIFDDLLSKIERCSQDTKSNNVTAKLRGYMKFGVLSLYGIKFDDPEESDYRYGIREFSQDAYFDRNYIVYEDGDLATFITDCVDIILAEIEEIFPESLHKLVKLLDKGIITDVVTKDVDSDHVEFTITMSNNEVISHTIDIRECNRICFDIILGKVTTVISTPVTTLSTSSIIINLQPRESVPQHPNIFFDSLHPDFEGICEIKNFNPLVTIPKNDNGVWKLLGDRLEAHIFINVIHYDRDWVKIAVEFQKRYDPAKVYMFISKDTDNESAMLFYRYMLLTLARFSD